MQDLEMLRNVTANTPVSLSPLTPCELPAECPTTLWERVESM